MTKIERDSTYNKSCTVFSKEDSLNEIWSVNKLINGIRTPRGGNFSQKQVQNAMKRIKKKYRANPIFILGYVLGIITPHLGINVYKRGRKELVIPVELRPFKKCKAAVKTLSKAIKQRKEGSLDDRIYNELNDVIQGKSIVFTWKKEKKFLLKRNRLNLGFRLKKKKKINL